MKLFLDDIRDPQHCTSHMKPRIGKLISLYLDDWIIVRDYESFVSAINDNARTITHISFDHDLAHMHYTVDMYKSTDEYYESIKDVKEKTGLDCAKYMKWYYDENRLPYPIMFVHSMNPVGTQAIIDLFKRKTI